MVVYINILMFPKKLMKVLLMRSLMESSYGLMFEVCFLARKFDFIPSLNEVFGVLVFLCGDGYYLMAAS